MAIHGRSETGGGAGRLMEMKNVLAGAGVGTTARIALLFAIFVFAYHEVIAGLVSDWATHSEYSHGFLIPVISAYLFWKRRDELMEARDGTSPVGFAVFVLGAAMLAAGGINGEEFLARLSVPVVLFGLIYFLRGRSAARISAFPTAYLLLMIPLPYILYKSLSLKLRMIDSVVVAEWSKRLGVPLYRDGYFLHLPDRVLEVADACSGTLSIFALVAIGFVYIYTFDTKRWVKAVLTLSLVPIAVVSNILRILVIVLVVHYWGDFILDSTFHRLNGLFNFILGMAIILAGGFVLDRFIARSDSRG